MKEGAQASEFCGDAVGEVRQQIRPLSLSLGDVRPVIGSGGCLGDG